MLEGTSLAVLYFWLAVAYAVTVIWLGIGWRNHPESTYRYWYGGFLFDPNRSPWWKLAVVTVQLIALFGIFIGLLWLFRRGMAGG